MDETDVAKCYDNLSPKWAKVKHIMSKGHSKRLREFRESLNLSQEELAERLEKPQRTYAAYENGRLPRQEVLEGLARLGLDLHWMITGEGAMIPSMRQPETQALMALNGWTPEDLEKLGRDDVALVPVYDVQVGAGDGRVNGNASIVSHMAFMASWLRRKSGIRNPKNGFIVEVKGRSMEKELYDGDLVLGEHMEEIGAEDVYCVRYHDELLIKNVQRVGPSLRLISNNSLFDPITIDYQEVEDDKLAFQVIGRAVRRLTRM